ncbi:MAG: aminotransferase class III-fold pyridoxal phosphate-dependent enzyme, partial [Desulfobacula sp.]
MHSIEDIKNLLETGYDLSGDISRLPGENENYLIRTKDEISYVLKLSDDQPPPGIPDIEHLAVERIYKAAPNISLPRVILTRTGAVEACLITPDRAEIRGRLLEFVEGKAWHESLPASIEQLENLGSLIAQLTLTLSGIVHPGSKRTHAWDLEKACQHRPSLVIIKDPEKRSILEWVFHLYAAIAVPLFDLLPRALIHGDLNDDNILVQNGRISGILDFGDCLENPVVCDLAIALAYHTLDEDDPLEAGAIIIGAYHKIRPLSPDEMTVIFPLMCARLTVSVIISAQRKKIDPERESWFVSEERAWQKLEVFSTIGPAQAAIILAGRTDLKPYENRGDSAAELLKKRRKMVAPSILPSYEKPLKFLYGKGQYLFDYNGRPFLDLYNNVCHVGHCHPKVVEAGQKQMARLNTNTRYLYDGLTEYAERLCNTLPKELDTCFFVNSGSEANELA